MAEDQDRRFYSLGSRILGGIALVLVAAVALTGVVDRDSGVRAWVVALMVLVAVLVYVAMLRQSLLLNRTSLVLYNMFDTVTIPLAAIEVVAIGQVMAIRADGRRYLSAAVGRSRREQSRDSRRRDGSRQSVFGGLGQLPMDSMQAHGGADLSASAANYESLVQEQILARRDRARSDIRKLGLEVAPVERRPAWLEIALAAAALAVTVVLFVLR